VLESLQREATLRKVVCTGRDRTQAMREVMEHYEPWQIVSAEPELVGGVLGFFQHEALVITIDESARRPSQAAPSQPLDAFLEEVRDDVILEGAPSRSRAGAADKSFCQVLGEVVSSLGEGPGEYRPPSLPARVAGPAAATPPAPRRDALADDDTAVRWTAACDLARSCGVPDSLIPSEVPDGPVRLKSVFCRLPAPPPLPCTSGGLIAVVGCSVRNTSALFGLLEMASSVRHSAQAIARTLGCAAEDIALVCERMPDRPVSPGLLAQSPAEVATFAPGWRRGKVGVAAVYAPALGEDQRWARDVLEAMRPSSVVAVVSATTKPEDLARWVAAIGGADALALVDVRATCTPGAVLSIGIPVLSLDGQAATPSCWAGVCAASS
jgi:hypothetical protein